LRADAVPELIDFPVHSGRKLVYWQQRSNSYRIQSRADDSRFPVALELSSCLTVIPIVRRSALSAPACDAHIISQKSKLLPLAQAGLADTARPTIETDISSQGVRKHCRPAEGA
jgi:hypothetical protein